MKKILTSLIFLSFIVITNAQIGIQTNTPDASAALDIVAADKGLLIPRVTLTNDLTNASPVTAPATGLLVFNTGANQPVGLYYWNGSSWNLFNAGSISSDYWNLTGNAGTTVGTNFIGTTDAEDFAIYTANSERMRFTSGGQGLIGLTTAYYAGDFVTIEGNATQNYALNVYSPSVGIYTTGALGIYSEVNGSSAYCGWYKNSDLDGWGTLMAGSGYGLTALGGVHSGGISSAGYDGIFAAGKDAIGTGIIAGGSATTSFSYLTTGSGGAFTGYHGVYGKATDVTAGNGVVGVGNNGTTYHTLTTGSGGAFSGYHGTYGLGRNTSQGIGVIGVGNDHGTYNTTSSGSGGAFTGYHGLISTAYDAAGTGVIGVGNGSSYFLYPSASGGAFTGNYCGVAGWATTDDNNSVGVYGYYDGVGSNRDGKGVVGIAAANTNRGYGVYGQGNRYGVYANGNLGASGTKSFAIDHPNDPENKILKHYSVESNEVLNMYRGNVLLDDNGEADVTLPDYFMTINIDFSYVLTPVGQKAPELFIKQEIDENGKFEIAGGNAGQKISWVVYADRNDPFMQKYKEREVDVIEKEPDNRGKYITPELYDQPSENGIFFIEQNSPTKTHNQNSETHKEGSVKEIAIKESEQMKRK